MSRRRYASVVPFCTFIASEDHCKYYQSKMKENRQDNGGQLPNKYGGPRDREEQGRLRFPDEKRMDMHVQGAGDEFEACTCAVAAAAFAVAHTCLTC